MAEDICYHDADTLFKVAEGIRRYGITKDEEISALILCIQNRGILFREVLPYI